jgi:hypothetical protein
MIVLNKTIRLFLDSVGRREEYEFYLSKFRAERDGAFALLCPDADSLEQGSELLTFDLQFLLRLELIPAILLCGPEAPLLLSRFDDPGLFVAKTLEVDALQESALAFIAECRHREKIPVLLVPSLSSLEALRQLTPAVARRIHFIRTEGGLHNADGDPVFYWYTHRDNRCELRETDLAVTFRARALLEACPGVHLSITSPMNLLREIFTVKGSGTVFRRGSVIHHLSSLGELELPRLIELLETSFGRGLRDASSLERASDIWLEENYRGTILLEPHSAGLYMSKFAVGREARGEGLALELWREACACHSAIFWRSRRDNPINHWYDKQADGGHLLGKWQIFWRGVAPEEISNLIQYCVSRPEDFV